MDEQILNERKFLLRVCAMLIYAIGEVIAYRTTMQTAADWRDRFIRWSKQGEVDFGGTK